MPDVTELALARGATARVHRAGSDTADAPVLVMHYGTPHTGAHPAPIAALAADLGIALVAVTRPGFAGVPAWPGRSVADAARDVGETLDRLGVDRYWTAGYSGGGPHALALAALHGDRVRGVATFASPAPFDGTDDWFAGMHGDGGGLRPASLGRAAREQHQREAGFDPAMFTPADWAALEGSWGAIGQDAGAAGAAESDAGEIDDDLAFVAPWGVDLVAVTAPVHLFQGAADRIIPAHHAERLAAALPTATLTVADGSGHVAVLDALPGWMRGLGDA